MNAIRGGRDGRRAPVRLPALILLAWMLAAPAAAPAAEPEAPPAPPAAPAAEPEAPAALPAAPAAEPESPAVPGGGRLKEVTVTKSPYFTNIEAVIEGKIENYNSFKLNDPFRIVVDVWGVSIGAVAPEIVADTPEVKSIKLSQQDNKLRFLIETPSDRALPFLVNADNGMLVLSVGGGPEEKVGSILATASAKRPTKGPAVVGIDLVDLPDVSNVVVTTAGAVSHTVSKKDGTVTLLFKGTRAGKDLLRQIDARKFAVPVKMITPAATKKGVRVAIAFAKGSEYSVEPKDNTVVISFAKGKEQPPTAVVARMSEAAPSAPPAEPSAEAASGPMPAPGEWGFLESRSESGRKYVGQKISLDFKDADLANIFRIIAEVSSLNIITSDDVKGKVSVRLVNVPWDQALDIILRSKSLGARMEGNVIRIAPLATLRGEEKARLDSRKETEKLRAEFEAESAAIRVNYAKASELLIQVKEALSEGGKANAVDRTNVIMVRDLPQRIEEIRAVIARLDLPTPQVLIEARIVEVDTSYSRELGVQWGGSYRKDGKTSYGIGGQMDAAGAPIPGQALQNAIPFSPTTTNPMFAVNLPAAIGQGAGGGIQFGILRDNLRLDLSLSALEASGKGKVISSPKVVTIDNKEAIVEQGVQIPYSTVSASGTNTIFVDATLSLKVTPQISPGGSVIMKIEAKNDSPGDVGLTGQPAINKKKATTNVLIRDGETAVIGGVLQITRKESEAAVPWLSKIPVLGYLFKKDTSQATNRELLIFVTPKILKLENVEASTN